VSQQLGDTYNFNRHKSCPPWSLHKGFVYSKSGKTVPYTSEAGRPYAAAALSSGYWSNLYRDESRTNRRYNLDLRGCVTVPADSRKEGRGDLPRSQLLPVHLPKPRMGEHISSPMLEIAITP
jgi:hypothetical protein